jgi:hypothetical protein
VNDEPNELEVFPPRRYRLDPPVIVFTVRDPAVKVLVVMELVRSLGVENETSADAVLVKMTSFTKDTGENPEIEDTWRVFAMAVPVDKEKDTRLPTLMVDAVTLLKLTLGPSAKEAPIIVLAVMVPVAVTSLVIIVLAYNL